MYSIFHTRKFDRELDKDFSHAEREEVGNIERKQLKENPYVGDPLGFQFFRKKKIGGKRVYYLIYEDLKAVLMIAVSDKKTQQATINEIRSHLKEYYEVVKEAIKQHDEYGHV